MNTSLVTLLKTILVLGMISVAYPLWVTWVLSEDLAAQYPQYTSLQWPYLLICGGLALCFEVLCVAMWKLLSRVRDGSIFDTHAITWVNVIVGAGTGASVLFIAALFPAVMITSGPPWLTLSFLAGAGTCVGFTLLMVVMRYLLLQATEFHDELDEVI